VPKEKTSIGNLLEGQAANLNDLIGYQEGAVVSRTLIDKKAGTVNLFAFDEGQGLSEHTAPFEALVLVIDGQAEITVGGKINSVAAGQAIILPANVPHAVKANERFKMMLTMIKG